jgi:DNA-binding CsgD family transcriptional regulator
MHRHELDVLRTLLGRGGAALVVGDAGVGRTALLEDVARTAPRTLWVRGVDAEVALPYAAVADLLLPLRRHFARLPAVQRDALQVAMALASGPTPNPLAVCAGALGVLSAAGVGGLLVLVEDFHDIDPASRTVLAFVARRLAGGHVSMLIAVHGQACARAIPLGIPALLLRGFGRAEAHQQISGVLEPARRTDACPDLPRALCLRSERDLWTGHWDAAAATAAEALLRAAEPAQPRPAGHALVLLARIDAARGDTATCHDRLARAQRVAADHGIDGLAVEVAAVRGFAALCLGEHARAVWHLTAARAAADLAGLAGPDAVPLHADLVEALLHTGDRDRAAELLNRLTACAAGSAHRVALVARYRGVLADDPDAARASFTSAQALQEGLPFERARTLLCEGETLRRLRRPAAARPALRSAFGVFNALGARPWTDRAQRELAATGVHTGRPDAGLDALTPQEFQIARAVAEGMSNSEAAAAMFVSRKTVEAHLTRVYRKLGLRSRTELAGTVARLQR